jgi:hypothetical protein
LEPLHRRLKDAERHMAELGLRKETIERRLVDPTIYQVNGTELADLLREQAGLNAALGEAEARWLEAANEIEVAEKAD